MIFLDTGFLFALFDEDDKDHPRVREVAERFRGKLLPDFVLTTNHSDRGDDHTYSFVDCLSFVVMEKRGIREAFAVDRDFTHRFVALPGPQAK